MVVGESGLRARSGVNRRFFLVMSLVLAAIVVFGFSHTVPSDISTPGFPPLLVVHGMIFAAWVVLFVAQPSLVAVGSIKLHRRVGWLGVALALAMVGLATSAILFGLWSNVVPPFYPHALFITRGFLGLLVFAGLVAAGIAQRRHADRHKRLMLCAAIIVVIPALERSLPLPLLGPGWPFVVDGVIDLLAIVGPVADLIAYRRIHPAYLYGVGAIVLCQVATDLLAPSSAATALLHLVGTS